MSLLVTGGAGYVGAHVATALLQAGRDVVVADDFSHARRDAVERIAAIAGRAPRVVDVDVTDASALARALAGESLEGVVHLAGLASSAESASRPLAYWRVNVGGTAAVREVVGDVPFVFSSSAAVYGAPWRCPVQESDACAPDTVYGFTKYAAERLLVAASAAAGGSPLAILRYFHAAGAHPSGLLGERLDGPPCNLMHRIERIALGVHPALTLHGIDYPTRDGTSLRDFVHVLDVAEAHVRALDVVTRERSSFTVNLGSERGYTVGEVVRAYEGATGRRMATIPGSRREGDVHALWASASQAAVRLGWRPTRTLEQMCNDALRWRGRQSAPVAAGMLAPL